MPFRNLNAFLGEKGGEAAIPPLAQRFRLLTDGRDMISVVGQDIRSIAALYEELLLFLEEQIVATGFKTDLIRWHKKIFVELEGLLAVQKKDNRHSFLVVIPVADRPLMLKNCLHSLLRQCADFNYGGKTVQNGNKIYARVAALVIDDSKDRANIETHKAIAQEMTRDGLSTHYVGLAEQSSVLQEIPERLRKNLRHILGDFASGVGPHKGASVTRNISCWLISKELEKHPENTLIYFIDSDEEFGIKVAKKGGYADIGIIDYFYWLDRLFTSQDIEVLTGKVVGDPPVSPAVMINTFLEDVLLFFKQVAAHNGNDRCIFHRPVRHGPAHYNDLVQMFGYKPAVQPFPYPCGLKGRHTMGDVFREFSAKINGFFYGQHPTRGTIYCHHGGPLNTSEARTVYTGNFVLKPEALRYFIPFADLKLRMAGPTLGRLLRARIGKKFVSANLPLLHRRTLSGDHQGEFRPGLNHEDKQVDLTDESVRQFWGDVLLFSVEELTKHSYPDVYLNQEFLAQVVSKTKEAIWHMYRQNSLAVSEKKTRLKDYLTSTEYWWNTSEDLEEAVNRCRRFLSNLELNFGRESRGYRKLEKTLSEGNFSKRIAKALHDFYEDERSWNKLRNERNKREEVDLSAAYRS